LIRTTLWIAGLGLLLAAFPRSASAQSGEAPALELYKQATKAFDAGDYPAACSKLEEVVKLVPRGVGGRLTLARCYERLGKLASAYTNYGLVEGLARDTKNKALEKEAQRAIASLEPRLARLTIAVGEGVRGTGGLEIARDGVPVGAALWGQAIPVDRGSHTITAATPGKRRWEKIVDVDADGASLTVSLDALEDMPPPSPPPAPPAPPPVVAAPRTPPADAPKPPPTSLSHRRQLGAVLRADINGQGKGVIAAPGLSFGISDYVEVAACALLGRDKGVEPSATVLFLRGAWKPRASLGIPIFVVNGARPGVRVAAGIQWDPSRYFGVFLDAGVAVFPSVPSDASREYQHVVFVPSVGLQPRVSP
jgi:hypothetical protein